ncbi:hypothetical protein TNCV_3631671 [Trichonephila clavipes]|nr:hypothetical protein TNCV_3631671 [Trichonephila clavipes]
MGVWTESQSSKSGSLGKVEFYTANWMVDGKGVANVLIRMGVGNASPFFGGVRGTPRNSSACKQQQGLYTNYCCNPYGKAAPHQ